MEIASAVELVRHVCYRPGWEFTAEDHSARFEGAITVKISYPTRNANRDQAPQGYPTEIQPHATFPMVVAECDAESLYRKLLACILEIEEHEAREFFRVSPTHWAPFHPHRLDGMRRWGRVDHDLRFGIA